MALPIPILPQPCAAGTCSHICGHCNLHAQVLPAPLGARSAACSHLPSGFTRQTHAAAPIMTWGGPAIPDWPPPGDPQSPQPPPCGASCTSVARGGDPVGLVYAQRSQPAGTGRNGVMFFDRPKSASLATLVCRSGSTCTPTPQSQHPNSRSLQTAPHLRACYMPARQLFETSNETQLQQGDAANPCSPPP